MPDAKAKLETLRELPHTIGENKVFWDKSGKEITSMIIGDREWKRGDTVTVATDKAQTVRAYRGQTGTIKGFAQYSTKNPIQVGFGTPDTGVWFSANELS